jgi:NAD(P)-dependent dehydrogenase (short-subunit alcohol dehydrogenase family)
LRQSQGEIEAAMMSDVSPEQMFRLDGKLAIVTGASSGFGAQFARVLSAAGAQVVLAARRLDRLEELASTLPKAVAFQTDVGDPQSAQQLVEFAAARTGQIDILVNNAGITDHVPALTEDLDLFQSVINVNLTGPFVLAQGVARIMRSAGKGGSIINVASVLGLVGVGQIPQAGYAAAKGGLVNMTRELGAQWARYGIRVNALCPGWFETDLTAGFFGNEQGRDWVRKRTPIGRGGAIHELDGALLFLASEASTYVIGQTVVVDGGWTAI